MIQPDTPGPRGTETNARIAPGRGRERPEPWPDTGAQFLGTFEAAAPRTHPVPTPPREGATPGWQGREGDGRAEKLAAWRMSPKGDAPQPEPPHWPSPPQVPEQDPALPSGQAAWSVSPAAWEASVESQAPLKPRVTDASATTPAAPAMAKAAPADLSTPAQAPSPISTTGAVKVLPGQRQPAPTRAQIAAQGSAPGETPQRTLAATSDSQPPAQAISAGASRPGQPDRPATPAANGPRTETPERALKGGSAGIKTADTRAPDPSTLAPARANRSAPEVPVDKTNPDQQTAAAQAKAPRHDPLLAPSGPQPSPPPADPSAHAERAASQPLPKPFNETAAPPVAVSQIAAQGPALPPAPTTPAPLTPFAPMSTAFEDIVSPLAGPESLSPLSPVQSASGATPQAAPMPAATPTPPAVQQIALSLTPGADGEIEVALTPEELGTVRLRIEGRDGAWIVTVLSDRPETLDHLRRAQADLAASFAEAGYDNPSFTFDRGDDAPQDQPRGQQISAAIPAPDAAPDMPAPTLVRRTGLDLKL